MSNIASGMAIGMASGMMLGRLMSEAEPIDFKCLICKHSYKKHYGGGCQSGMITKCNCTQFLLDERQVTDAEKEINELRNILFKNFETAQALQ